MTSKNLLPYLAIPLIAAAYLARNHTTDDAITMLRAEALIAFGYAAAYADLKTRKIPNKLIVTMLAVWALLLAVYTMLDLAATADFLVQSLISGGAAGGFFLLLYAVSRKGVGGGDVKLMAAMGLFMTVAKLLPMLFFSSLLAALASAVLLLTKRATMKTAIPLAPFLYAGTLVGIFL
jgi:leader peptidase (prepilin peptidase)/N-methyltransferase